jgi:anionic cell wall polymer biosynthesis LytR-Cps2A-Psr (LCP) family protein
MNENTNNTKIKVRKRKRRFDKYRKRKILFWFLLFAIILIGLIIFLFLFKTQVQQRYIRVGICGAIHKPAVYTMREGSDLSMLVMMAHGFTLQADVHKVNLERIVFHDSIYHIPESGVGNNSKSFLFMNEVNQTINTMFSKQRDVIAPEVKEKEIKIYSILYVGLPAVFVLINYYPEYKRINFVHLPHSTMFLTNNYRLSDMFFTLGVYPTMRILENRLKQRIDFYMIQDRYAFIDLIDRLGGVNVNLDKPYADAYELKDGNQQIDGFHAWEYIRFLDWKNIKLNVRSDKKIDLIQKDNFSVDPGTWERIYETRNQRQRYVLMAMRKAFTTMNTSQQMDVIQNFHEEFKTDMTNDFLIQFYTDLLRTRAFSFGSLPGYYGADDDKLFFYPDIPKFEMLRKQEIRRELQKRATKDQTVY